MLSDLDLDIDDAVTAQTNNAAIRLGHCDWR